MYKGEVQLPQRDLMSFILVAKALKIRGLSDLSPNEPEQNLQSNDFQDTGRSDCGGRQENMGHTHNQQSLNQNNRRMEPNTRVPNSGVPSMNAPSDGRMKLIYL